MAESQNSDKEQEFENQMQNILSGLNQLNSEMAPKENEIKKVVNSAEGEISEDDLNGKPQF